MQDFEYLRNIKMIAIVGLSDKPERPSYQVAQYLLSKGYKIIPVNPTISEVFGLKSFASLEAIPQQLNIDLVDIFRRSEEVMPVVEAAIAREVPHIWLQEGVKNDAAAEYALARGATVAQDICLMKTLKLQTK